MAQSRILSQAQDGLDIRRELAVVKTSGHFNLAAPWLARTVCPRCFGRGEALAQAKPGSILRSVPCHRCGGHGYLETAEEIAVSITPKMAEAGLVKVKGAGLHDCLTGRRGDLYLTLKFVDSLPSSH
jgi:DnaJ-class molecular chaperone